MQSLLRSEVWHWRFTGAQLKDECIAENLAESVCAEFSIDARRSADLELVLAELINNSIDHGILQLDSSLKKDLQGFEEYFVSRARGLAELQHGYIDICVEWVNAEVIRISVQDSGNGFDFENSNNDVTEDNILLAYGRGLLIVRNLCNSITHIGNGNCVVADFGVRKSCTVDVV